MKSHLLLFILFFLLLGGALTPRHIGKTVPAGNLLSDQVQVSPGTVSPNTHVDRGLILSGHPLSHLVFSGGWRKLGLPNPDSLSSEAKLRLAIQEFNAALERKDDLQGYSDDQVHAFLGYAYTSLGTELQRQMEKASDKSGDLKNQSQEIFSQGFSHYRLALISLPADLKYKIAIELAQAVITSGDLNQAIKVINDLEQQQLGPNPGSDHALVRMKADIYWFMAREMDAALAYEEWIKRGNTSNLLRPGGTLTERLKYLKEKTGRLSDFKVK